MKKAIKLTLAVALMLSASSLFAQKFGRINSQEILLAMPETKEMETNMQAYGKDLQDNLETITVEFNQKYLDFQKNFDTYSDAVKQLKQKELQELQNRREEFEQVAQQDYQKKQQELLTPIIEREKAAIGLSSRPARWLRTMKPRLPTWHPRSVRNSASPTLRLRSKPCNTRGCRAGGPFTAPASTGAVFCWPVFFPNGTTHPQAGSGRRRQDDREKHATSADAWTQRTGRPNEE